MHSVRGGNLAHGHASKSATGLILDLMGGFMRWRICSRSLPAGFIVASGEARLTRPRHSRVGQASSLTLHLARPCGSGFTRDNRH
jgi:hypothetical protein